MKETVKSERCIVCSVSAATKMIIVNPKNKGTFYKHKHASAAGEVSNLAFPLVYS